MRLGKLASLGVVFGTMLLHGSLARADFSVQYLADGGFGAALNPVYTQGPIQITFNPNAQSVILPTASPTSQVSFGQFNTSGTVAGTPLTTLNPTPFTLRITQLLPGPGQGSFLGTLQGTLGSDTSGAFVQFAPPLNMVLAGILYQITSNDSSTPGRVNIAPKTTNGGVTTIVGQVSAVPEPTSLLLMAMGCPIVLGLVRRGRSKKALVA